MGGGGLDGMGGGRGMKKEEEEIERLSEKAIGGFAGGCIYAKTAALTCGASQLAPIADYTR